jgi:hypothetical protein
VIQIFIVNNTHRFILPTDSKPHDFFSISYPQRIFTVPSCHKIVLSIVKFVSSAADLIFFLNRDLVDSLGKCHTKQREVHRLPRMCKKSCQRGSNGLDLSC